MTTNDQLIDDRRDAVLSDDREYRYRLTRTWDVSKPAIAFVMLNPSTADETSDDRTIRRCIGYATEWGYGTLLVGNLFALRATDPDALRAHPEPIGPLNDVHLHEICADAEQVVAAWGANGELLDRGREVAAELEFDLYALDTTQAGHPKHPLYLPASAKPDPFSYGGD